MRALAIVSACAAIAIATPATAQTVSDQVDALRAMAGAAYAAGDLEGARRAFEADLALQPGHAALMLEIGALFAEQGAITDAAARLDDAARLGAAFDIERLRARLGEAAEAPEIAAALDRIAANAAPFGAAQTIANVDDPDLLIEGVAVAPDGRIFVSAIVGRQVLVAEVDGPFELFADAEDGLQSAAGLVIDAERGLLWVATGAAPQTPLAEGEAPAPALIALDLESGEPRARLEPPEGAGRLADFTLAPDGALYVADSEVPRIYRAPGPEGPLTLFAETNAAMSLQGSAVVGDALYIADYGRGLFRVSLDDGSVSALRQPSDVSLIGVDGLVAHEGGLIAVQNGFSPYRVVRVALSADGRAVTDVEPLVSGLEEFFDPTLGQVVDGRFVFIANSQWPLFPEEGEPDAPRQPVRVMAIDLDR